MNKKIFVLINFVFSITLSFCVYSQIFPWEQKIIIKDFAGNYKGWVKIFISTCGAKNCCYIFYDLELNSEKLTPNNLENLIEDKSLVSYCATIITDTDLPFWFFSGKSKTYEYEIYDKNFSPIVSIFELQGEKESFKITTKKDNEFFNILWKSSKGTKKERNLRLPENILTAGNLRSIIMSLDLSKKETKTFSLLDKFKLETKQVKITTVGKAEIINNKETYKINIDIGLFGKFSFYIDKNYNVVYGEGMGIKVFPE